MKQMFKNVLIISDNPYLSKKFFEIIDRKKLTDSNFSLSISPFSNHNDFETSDGSAVQIFDLRDQPTIAFIKQQFDLVFSIHCKQIFPIDLINHVKCINIHPGFNPINRGWYPQVFSILNKLPVGATIHEIDEKLDHGGIIARAYVTKNAYDTSESLYNKIIAKEIELLEQYIEEIISGDYSLTEPEEEGNLYLKKDFNNLLELDLNQQTTVGDLIDRLRALTHGKYNNAFFIDPATGDKVFVGISLKPQQNE